MLFIGRENSLIIEILNKIQITIALLSFQKISSNNFSFNWINTYALFVTINW
jgi:hypothetical protein